MSASALSPTIQSLLNSFAQTQPALNLPGQPVETSNINLGNLLAAATLASGTVYSASTPADWATSAPTDVNTALNRMAALLYTLHGAAIP